ncbi:MAG: GntR family transcriptional regulator [Spirochaetales bacterium]|nr:GntR family transcriptional regulator [Spirochaetales bacterium]
MKEKVRHLYEIVYSGILSDIQNGTYPPGALLPPENEIAQVYDVSRITTKKALDMLVEQGLVHRIRGKGTFVQKEAPTKSHAEALSTPSLLGFVLPDYSGQFACDLMRGVEAEATERGYLLVHQRSHGIQSVEEKIIDGLKAAGIQGLIVMPVHGENYSPSFLKLVLDQFPLVFVDRYLKGLPAPCVSSDNVHSARQMVDYLVELGHQKICFVSPPTANTSTLEDRIHGFEEGISRHGMVIDRDSQFIEVFSTMPGKSGDENADIDVNTIVEHLQNHPEITTLFASEYNIAHLCRVACRKLNLRIPEDLSIVCYDEPSHSFGEHFFTHIRQDEELIGRKAVQVLLDKLSGQESVGRNVVSSHLITGKSTSSPR